MTPVQWTFAFARLLKVVFWAGVVDTGSDLLRSVYERLPIAKQGRRNEVDVVSSTALLPLLSHCTRMSGTFCRDVFVTVMISYLWNACSCKFSSTPAWTNYVISSISIDRQASRTHRQCASRYLFIQYWAIILDRDATMGLTRLSLDFKCPSSYGTFKAFSLGRSQYTVTCICLTINIWYSI